MDYLRVRCFHCGGGYELYSRDMDHEARPPMCPHCLSRMDKTQWGRLIDAYFTISEVNKNFRKYHEDRGEPLFQVELRNYYVEPEKIVFNDDLTGRKDIGVKMEKALKAMPGPLADIVRKPVENRCVADYE